MPKTQTGHADAGQGADDMSVQKSTDPMAMTLARAGATERPAGTKRIQVKLQGCATLLFDISEREDPEMAFVYYKRHCGIRSTMHVPELTEVKAETAPAA